MGPCQPAPERERGRPQTTMSRPLTIPPALYATASLLLLFVFFYRGGGPLSPNDGSHWALSRALAYNHTTVVDREYQYTGGVDIAYHAGHYYSDRAPGTAFLGALCLYLRLSQKVVPALGAWVAVLCSFLIVRRWCSPWPALLTATAVALGTLTWRYSHVFFSHALAEGHVLLGVYLALLLAERRRPPWWLAALLGWVTGYALLVEYQLLALTPLLWGYVAVRRYRAEGVAGLRRLWPGLALWAVPVALLALYQQVSFGSPWHTSYAYRLGWHEGMAFEGNLLRGLRGLLVGDNHNPPGLLTLSPVLWLALWGACLLRKSVRWKEIVFCLGVFAALLCLLAIHPSWNGATTQDTRYLVCIVPLLMLPLGLWVEKYLLVPGEPWPRLMCEGLFYGLLFVSIGLNGHELFYKYKFDTGGPASPIIFVFDPNELFFGFVAGVPFDRIFWLFGAFGAGAALAHTLRTRLVLRRGQAPPADRP